MITEKIKLYEDRTDVTLTTYILEDSPEMLNGTLRPAIIICPGGAYMSCSDREGEPVAMKFASMGYHAFVLRYSVYHEGKGVSAEDFENTLKSIPPKKHCQNPMPMREIGQAMLILREHAEEWKVDVDRVAVCGFSAGGHNAAMYAANWHTELLSEYFGKDAELFRPAACILGYPLTDYVYMKEAAGKSNPTDAAFFEASNTAFLGEPMPDEKRLEEVSPARNVTEYMPPTFIWTTAGDKMVPVQHSIRMAHALADEGILFEIHIFEEGDHGLALATQASAMSKSQCNADVAKWADLAGNWLMKRFELELPEKAPFEIMMENNKSE